MLIYFLSKQDVKKCLLLLSAALTPRDRFLYNFTNLCPIPQMCIACHNQTSVYLGVLHFRGSNMSGVTALDFCTHLLQKPADTYGPQRLFFLQ